MGNITFYWKASLTLSGPWHLHTVLLVYLVIAEGWTTNSQRNRSICWDSKQMKCNHRPLNPDQFSLIPIDWGSTFNQAAARRHICVPLPVKHSIHPTRNFRKIKFILRPQNPFVRAWYTQTSIIKLQTLVYSMVIFCIRQMTYQKVLTSHFLLKWTLLCKNIKGYFKKTRSQLEQNSFSQIFLTLTRSKGNV